MAPEDESPAISIEEIDSMETDSSGGIGDEKMPKEEDEEFHLTQRRQERRPTSSSSCWKAWLLKTLRSHKTRLLAATTAILALALYYRRRRRRALSGHSTASSYRSATTVPLSLLLTLLDQEGSLEQALLGRSRIYFRAHHQAWSRVDLPANTTLQEQILARLSSSTRNNIGTLPPEFDWTAGLSLMLGIAPFVYLGLAYRMLQNGGHLERTTAQATDHSNSRSTTFQDVAGLDAVLPEVSEIVEYLRNPERYHQLGASSPKGVLLHGPPVCFDSVDSFVLSVLLVVFMAFRRRCSSFTFLDSLLYCFACHFNLFCTHTGHGKDTLGPSRCW